MPPGQRQSRFEIRPIHLGGTQSTCGQLPEVSQDRAPSGSGRLHDLRSLGGPEALTPLEVVKIFEEESGRRFEVETIPEAKLREQFDLANDPLEKSFAGLLLQYAQGETVDMRGLLESIPVRQTSVREYARTVMEPHKRA
jgi:hypothetical protein